MHAPGSQPQFEAQPAFRRESLALNQAVEARLSRALSLQARSW
jgi:hypothetical protein